MLQQEEPAPCVAVVLSLDEAFLLGKLLSLAGLSDEHTLLLQLRSTRRWDTVVLRSPLRPIPSQR